MSLDATDAAPHDPRLPDSLPSATVRPCGECPWRRDSAPGWLGPMTADEWVGMAHSDTAIACHETIDVDESWATPKVRQCAGAATYRGNIAKRPRDPEVAVLPADREHVFANPTEFRDHHERHAR